MLNDEPGNIFRERPATGFDQRGQKVDPLICILIVDPILGSRFSLAQAVSGSGYLIRSASTVGAALHHLEQNEVSLVIVDQQLTECDGLDFLVEVRGRYPAARRVLVTANESTSFVRGTIGPAGLCSLLNKPWSPISLRRTIRKVLDGGSGTKSEFKGWVRLTGQNTEASEGRVRMAEARQPETHHDVLLRGLLAGFNSCEFESEVYELLHSELSRPFRIRDWLWVDEDRETATRLEGDWPVEQAVSARTLDSATKQLLSKAHRSHRVTRLGDEQLTRQSDPARVICVGLTFREQARPTRTCLIWAAPGNGEQLVSMMRELQVGLQMVFRRIQLAEARAEAARRLARHVSDELRTPVGALAHAIDRLRGEAKRAGLSTKWVDRVSSESDRVVRAVEQIEGEMRTDAAGLHSSTG